MAHLKTLPQGELYDIYAASELAQKTREQKFCSVLDLDGTFAAGSPEARKEVRSRLESRGALVFSTARTPELVMSSGAYGASRALSGFTRGAPNWDHKDGKRAYAPLETLAEFDDQLDPDAVLGFGEGVYVANKVGTRQAYFLDDEYERLYLDPQLLDDGKPWRAIALALVERLGFEEHLAPIDRAGAYAERLANVEPLRYRIQLDFGGELAVQKKYEILRRIKLEAKRMRVSRKIEGVDESKPSDDPAQNRATLYLMPPQARKEDMLNRLLTASCRAAQLQSSDVTMLIAGDTLTDFYAGCYAGWDADVVFIVVGGSRLSKCIEEKVNFAGVDLRRMHRGLLPTERKGFYLFDNPLMRGGWIKKGKKRTIVMGDAAYPGTIGAETILAYLHEHKRALAL